MTVNIYESPSKEEVASGRPYDEADAEDENNIQTMCPVDYVFVHPIHTHMRVRSDVTLNTETI